VTIYYLIPRCLVYLVYTRRLSLLITFCFIGILIGGLVLVLSILTQYLATELTNYLPFPLIGSFATTALGRSATRGPTC
jgi:hypothetical protein